MTAKHKLIFDIHIEGFQLPASVRAEKIRTNVNTYLSMFPMIILAQDLRMENRVSFWVWAQPMRNYVTT